MASDLIVRRLTAAERDGFWRFAFERGLGGSSREEFRRGHRPGLVGGLLAERGRRLAGFLLYAIHMEGMAVTVVAIGVMPTRRRRGIGSALLADLTRRLQAAGPARIDALVGERDLQAQLFLRANGFRAVRVVPAALAGNADDGYCFERHVPPARPAPPVRNSRRRKPTVE